MDLPAGLPGSGPAACSIKPQLFSMEMWVSVVWLQPSFSAIWSHRLAEMGPSLTHREGWHPTSYGTGCLNPPPPRRRGCTLGDLSPGPRQLTFPDSTANHLGPKFVPLPSASERGGQWGCLPPHPIPTPVLACSLLGGPGIKDLVTACPSAHKFQPAPELPLALTFWATRGWVLLELGGAVRYCAALRKTNTCFFSFQAVFVFGKTDLVTETRKYFLCGHDHVGETGILVWRQVPPTPTPLASTGHWGKASPWAPAGWGHASEVFFHFRDPIFSLAKEGKDLFTDLVAAVSFHCRGGAF